MYSKIFNDKKFLSDCLKFASTKTASKNITDVYIEFFKLAAEAGGMSEMLDLPNKQIREILGRPVGYEEKKYELQKILKDNLGLINYIASEKTKSRPDVEEKVTEFISLSFIDYMLNSFLEKYQGNQSKDFTLSGAINGAIAQASKIINQKAITDKKKKESLEERQEAVGEQFAAPEQKMFQVESGGELPASKQINEIKKLFQIAYSNTAVPLLGIYLRNLFGERLKLLEEANNSGKNISEDIDQLKSDIESFFNQQYYKKKYYSGEDKRKGQKQEFTLQEFEKQFLQDSDLKKELDDISKYVINSMHYEMPKSFRDALKDPSNRQLIEIVIKQLIFAFVIRYTTLHHGVSLPGSGKRTSRGVEKAAFGRDILKPLIENAFASLDDPELQEQMVYKALSIVGKTEFGEFKSTDYTTDHAGYMALHGMIEKERHNRGGSFAGMDGNDVNKLMEKIYQTLHNTESGHMPHLMRRENNPAFFTLKKPSDSETEIKNNIKNEIQKIVNIDSGSQTSTENTTIENKKESALQTLIKKYAKN